MTANPRCNVGEAFFQECEAGDCAEPATRFYVLAGAGLIPGLAVACCPSHPLGFIPGDREVSLDEYVVHEVMSS